MSIKGHFFAAFISFIISLSAFDFHFPLCPDFCFHWNVNFWEIKFYRKELYALLVLSNDMCCPQLDSFSQKIIFVKSIGILSVSECVNYWHKKISHDFQLTIWTRTYSMCSSQWNCLKHIASKKRRKKNYSNAVEKIDMDALC